MGNHHSTTEDTCTRARKAQRVVPGPSWWWWHKSAIGPGNVGTVISATPARGGKHGTVDVLWDSGVLASYPAEPTAACALRLYDSGPAGLQHPQVTCHACREYVVGTRWKCTVCCEYNLCHLCYMKDRHNLHHSFYRFDFPGAQGMKVAPRSESAKTQVFGIFPGAKVKQGRHWESRKQQPVNSGAPQVPPDSTGTVRILRDSNDGSKRNKAEVYWTSGAKSICRVGYNGYVDIKCSEAAPGGHFYSDHMPLIGFAETCSRNSSTGCPNFWPGDKVAILMDVDAFMQLQGVERGWEAENDQDVYRVGTVVDVIHGGDVSVRFGKTVRWPVNPAALTKAPWFNPGDEVKIIDNLQDLKKMQEHLGGYAEEMRKCLKKKGVVLKVFQTEAVRVMVSGSAWTFSPYCLRLLPSSVGDINARLTEAARRHGTCEVVAEMLPDVIDTVVEGSPQASGSRTTRRPHASEDQPSTSRGTQPPLSEQYSPSKESALEVLRRIVRYWINIESNEDSTRGQKKLNGLPLHLACHSGEFDAVRLMASGRIDLETGDCDGDRPLHYAVYGNESSVLELLLSLKVDVNATNKWRRTALHIAASNAFVDCVRVLVKHTGELDVNAQDDHGCTPLHEAIGKNMDIICLLLEHPGVNFHIKNDTGFTILHQAALSGDSFATEAIASEAPELVGVKDKGDCTPLHLAARNGHYQVVTILLNQEGCMVDDLNMRQRTALWLAVSNGHVDVAEMLVENGADVNKPDEDGNSPMHMSLLQRSEVQFDAINSSTAPCIAAVAQHLLASSQLGVDSSLALAWFLAKRGGDLHQKNSAGITSLEMANNLCENVAEALLIWKTSASADLYCSRDIGGASATTSENGPANASSERTEINEARLLRSRLREIRSKFQEMEDAKICGICCERQLHVAFNCGHRACALCAERLTECHLCRKRITSKITLY